MTIEGKICPTCTGDLLNKIQPYTAFYLSKGRISFRCKKCVSIRNKSLRKDPIEGPKLKERYKKWAVKKKDVINVKNKQRREKNADKLKEYYKEWYAVNKHKRNARRNTRKAVKRQLEASVKELEPLELKDLEIVKSK